MVELPKTPSMRLEGKRALVTGASSGIGLACATALAEYGAHVVCAARRSSKLNELVDAIKANGWQAQSLILDVSDIDKMESVLSQQDSFDIVVNSAGLARHGPALEANPSDFDAVMNVNLKGAYFLSAITARNMMKFDKSGSIIHISSQMGYVGGIERSIYCASKHAVEGFIKAMAIEWGPKKIRINSICPTFIRTSLTESTFENPERVKWIEEKIKLGRTGEVEDIMGAVIYLASDASDLVTGTALMVDGGWTAE